MAQRRWLIPLLCSILAALVTLGLKFSAYFLTGSVGLLSDAAESIINLLASVTALLSLIYAQRPIDSSHTYGHEKIEFISSGFEGGLIVIAGFVIAGFAVQRLFVPVPLQTLEIGLAISLGASLINGVVARILLRVGRELRSIALEADGQHLMTDVWTSLAVIAGLGLVWWTGITLLDPVIAIFVALNILWTGVDLVRRSFDGLMDHALSMAEQDSVRAAIQAHLLPGMDFHALRTRQAGPRRFADFHLLVPGAWSVQHAHDVTERIEEAVRSALAGIEVTVHIEPIEERAAWEDSALLSVEQAQRREQAEKKGNEAEPR